MAMSEQFDLAMQIVRENFRGVAKQVYERDGVIVVEMVQTAGLELPDNVRGYRVKRVDPGTLAKEHASERAREDGTPAREGTGSAAADSRLEAARAENARLRRLADQKVRDDATQKELDELAAENARLRAETGDD